MHHGTAEERLPKVLADAVDDPLLLFLDPYGLVVPFDPLVSQVLSRTAITAVVINFSLAAMQRLRGFLDKDYRAKTEPGPPNLLGERPPPDMTPEKGPRRRQRSATPSPS